MDLLRLMRPAQWTKNLFLLAGIVFGHKLLIDGRVNWPLLGVVALGLLLFCLLSSAVYILNDIRDRAEDRLHPNKRHRPLAAGRVSVEAAAGLTAALLVIGLGGSFLLDRAFFLVALVYLAVQAAYTFALKHVVVLDVIMIGMGFVLRAVAGAVLVHVEISHWLVLCTFTLCLFMGFSKRRCELDVMVATNGQAARHRRTLAEYTPDLLNHMTTLTAGVAIVSFMLYATDQRTIRIFGTNYLIYTLPLVVYAVFRFALLVEHGRVDGPTAVLLRDRPFQAALLLWSAAVLVIVYWGRELQAWIVRLADRGG
ncbi:MAG: decaprenyl-phosphate phosphoribosyltransferase [Phycisphaerales bacterium]|nr:decaprenyl-phosphate phosphoribosyltransferase [Phycisphaerales bacterium]